MRDYKPNSHRFKEEQKESSEKKVEKVVTGKVKTKKKSEVRKLADIFIPGDISNVKSYILMDVLVPAVKKAISDIVVDGIDMILYNGERRDDKRRGNSSKVSYRNYYDRREDRFADEGSRRTRYSYDDIILDSRGEAEEVLERMDELIDTYKMVTVADLYDLVGSTGSYTDCNYGWTNIRTATVVHVRDGYMLKLPKPLPID